MSRPHLLLIGWHRPGTGFTRVLEALVRRLREHYRITWIGIGADGDERALTDGVRLVPVIQGRGDPVGAYLARDRIALDPPDTVLAFDDLWYLEHHARVLGPVLGGVPMHGYLPVDGQIPDDLVLPDLRGFRRLATFTHTAAQDLSSALGRCGQVMPVSVVGHGVETEVFRPSPATPVGGLDIDHRRRLARDLFELPHPAFVVLNASRPDPRKRIDLTIAGFARFAHRVDEDVRLCLHQAIAHDQAARALRAQIDEAGIADRVIWWPHRPGPVDDIRLTALYNACAVGLNTSVGEGFGLVSFEHAACGVPQLLPDHAALRELWGDAALRVAPVTPILTPHSPLRMGVVSAEAVADALTDLHGDPRRYRLLARAALAHARQPRFTWDAVADDMRAVLRAP